MRKFKDLSFTEKLLLALSIILFIAIFSRWPQVKEGFKNGWSKFVFFKTEVNE